MLTLHHAPQSRSSRVVWLLEEPGADHRLVITDIPRRDELTDKFPAAGAGRPIGHPERGPYLARCNAPPAPARALAKDGG